MQETKYRILYIDDEIVNLRLFKNSFRRDFEVITAESAKEGLIILENESVDIIITDQIMPEMTGVELLEIINNKFPNIPPNRMIISGYASDDAIDKAFKKFRLFKFISKPWKYDKLKALILNAIK